MLLERLLYRVITDGVTYLVANPNEVVRFFGEDACLDSTDVGTEPTEISALFVKRPPTTVHGFLRRDLAFPAYCITLGSDSTYQQYLGDEAGFMSDGVDAGRSIDSEVRAYTFVILVVAQHPDHCLYLYHILMWILARGKRELLLDGVLDVSLSGAEVVPDANTAPAGLFIRRLTVTMQREWTVVAPVEGVSFGTFRITGAHYDAPTNGDPGADVGGVIGNVGTFLGDDDD